jgi:hypothetical protein
VERRSAGPDEPGFVSERYGLRAVVAAAGGALLLVLYAIAAAAAGWRATIRRDVE